MRASTTLVMSIRWPRRFLAELAKQSTSAPQAQASMKVATGRSDVNLPASIDSPLFSRIPGVETKNKRAQ